MDEQQNSSYPLSTSETETSAPLILSDPDNISTPARASRVTVCLQYSRTLTAESFTLKMTLSRHSRGGLRSSSTITLSVVVPLLIMPILIIVIIICWWMNYTKNKTDKRKIHVEIQHDTKLAGLRDEINRIDDTAAPEQNGLIAGGQVDFLICGLIVNFNLIDDDAFDIHIGDLLTNTLKVEKLFAGLGGDEPVIADDLARECADADLDIGTDFAVGNESGIGAEGDIIGDLTIARDDHAGTDHDIIADIGIVSGDRIDIHEDEIAEARGA